MGGGFEGHANGAEEGWLVAVLGMASHQGRVAVGVPDEPGELHRCPGRVDQGSEESIVGLGEMLGGPRSMRHVFADGLKTLKGYVEDLGEAHDALLAVELALAELDLRHVFPGESPPLGEVLLSPAALVSEGSDEASERTCRWFELCHVPLVSGRSRGRSRSF